MTEGFSPRRIGYAAAALVAVLVTGTVGFRWSLGESWLQSFYRSIATSALVGLDTVPRSDSARLLSIMAIAGVTIFAFVASTLVEGIARGVLTGALAEKRRRRAIEGLRDHSIICGYGRVGRQIAGAERVVQPYAAQLKEGDVTIAAGTDEELGTLDSTFNPAEALAGR